MCRTKEAPPGRPSYLGGGVGVDSDCKDALLLRGSPNTIKDYQLNKTRSDWGHYALLD